MVRNTFVFISLLAVVAALLVGINVGKKLTAQPTVPLVVTPTPTPPPTTISYTNSFCGFSVTYPSTLFLLEDASGSAILNNSLNKEESIAMTCQDEIPRPPLPTTQIDKLSLGTTKGTTISANLYHNSSAKDGEQMDALIFHHPT